MTDSLPPSDQPPKSPPSPLGNPESPGSPEGNEPGATTAPPHSGPNITASEHDASSPTEQGPAEPGITSETPPPQSTPDTHGSPVEPTFQSQQQIAPREPSLAPRKNSLKERWQTARQNFRPKLAEMGAALRTRLSAIDWANLSNLLGKFSSTARKSGLSTIAMVVSVMLCAYFLSDLTALLVGKWIPTPPPTKELAQDSGSLKKHRSVDSYSSIWSRNLFNSKGLIPGEEGPPGVSDPGGAPVRTTLPLALVGTLILSDELKSIATLEDKSAAVVYPVRVEDEIPSKLRVLKVEPSRVVFLNIASGRREFVDIPSDGTPTLTPKIGLPGKLGAPSGAGIDRVSATTFNVARTEVDKALADLNQVLTQARAIPNIENGVAAGYKLFQIVPGSIYDKLGLQNGDVITGLNGQPVNDPGKAFEMLNELKTASFLELNVKRDGKTSAFSYHIGSRP